MEILIKLIIGFYFGANLFAAGVYFSDNYKWQKSNTERLLCLLRTFGTMLFGCAYVALLALYIILYAVYQTANSYWQLSFWFTFYFTKQWDNLAKKDLDYINESLSKHTANTLKDRIYRYCVFLVNKRNPAPPIPKSVEPVESVSININASLQEIEDARFYQRCEEEAHRQLDLFKTGYPLDLPTYIGGVVSYEIYHDETAKYKEITARQLCMQILQELAAAKKINLKRTMAETDAIWINKIQEIRGANKR